MAPYIFRNLIQKGEMMNKIKTVVIFSVGVGIGYAVGERIATNSYQKWQEEHQFKCWKSRKRPEKLGDYPQVFVIDTRNKEDFDDRKQKRSCISRILQKV